MGKILHSFGEHRIDVDGVVFTIRPRDYQDMVKATDFVDDLVSERIRAIGFSSFEIINRITAWEGVETPDGEPVPCTQENKMKLFAEYPNVAQELIKRLFEAEGKEEEGEKNSETSQAG